MATHHFAFTAMGSPGRIVLCAADRAAAEAVAQAMMAEVARIEARYSRFRPASLLSGVNRAAAAGESVTLDEETAGLLDYAFSCHRRSGGLFDITAGLLRRLWDTATTVPSPSAVAETLARVGLSKLDWQPPKLAFPVPGMDLDFGGIGKEYAVDRAAEICAEQGLGGLVDLGGDIRVTGPRDDGTAWPVGVRAPRNPDALAACLAISRGAVATSGDYERFTMIAGKRYGHILDPLTGWPVRGLAAVTVVADTCLLAGTVATIAMLKGSDGAAWLGETGLPHLWIDGGGRQGEHALPRAPVPA